MRVVSDDGHLRREESLRTLPWDQLLRIWWASWVVRIYGWFSMAISSMFFYLILLIFISVGAGGVGGADGARYFILTLMFCGVFVLLGVATSLGALFRTKFGRIADISIGLIFIGLLLSVPISILFIGESPLVTLFLYIPITLSFPYTFQAIYVCFILITFLAVNAAWVNKDIFGSDRYRHKEIKSEFMKRRSAR